MAALAPYLSYRLFKLDAPLGYIPTLSRRQPISIYGHWIR